ncbi:MAG: proton-conducting membrane transporter [Lachnospiraceae bacterium]|nr:proton-conducting membrane transporter [Lachnospiraceae bacterium]
MNDMILVSIILPIIIGGILIFLPDKIFADRSSLLKMTGVSFAVSALAAVYVISGAAGNTLTLFRLVSEVPVYFAIDNLGRIFAGTVVFVFLLAGFFSFVYMSHEKNEKRYYGFYLITFGVLMGLCFSGNLVTMYLFYEFMTLVSMPLVIHSGTKEAVMAALKYLFYSFAGAYMALFGIYFLYQYAAAFENPGAALGGTYYETVRMMEFVPGGFLDRAALIQSGNVGFCLVAVFLMIVGFGVKAGCFPFHAWLPTAHPVAPAPASAFLSGIIVKGGVLAIIRTVYYCVGADFLRGTWVQTAWAILAIVTLLMGSSLAFKEKIMKKRLAYSTVSNLSYILLGLSMLNAAAFTGSLLHVVFHAIIKSALFLSAGALIFTTGRTKANDFMGLGKKMPVLFWCYTIVSLGLIGIPPTSGIISKWYLAVGCLESGLGALSWAGPAALLISALLTAGYLLPISVRGFLMEPDYDAVRNDYREPQLLMLVPIVILAAAAFLLGFYPTPLIRLIDSIAGGLF